MTPLKIGLAALVLLLLSSPVLSDKPDDTAALSGVTAGRVVFVSLIGYQARGYALIPIY